MLIAQAHAKINWALDILGVREDGYHRMDMLMQSISLCDTLCFEQADQLTLMINGQRDALEEENLIVRAARLLQAESRFDGGARINVVKRIPARAGLGGGSADCAAALIALNRLWKLGFSQEDLLRLGLRLGADVPFCLTGGLMRVGGIGERLTPMSPSGPANLLLVMPDDGLNTREVFREYDAGKRCLPLVNMDGAAEALARGEYVVLNERARNVLTEPAMRMSASVAPAIHRLREQGAVMARMSGSGSAVFGLFAEAEGAERARRALMRQYAFCEVVHTWHQGVTLDD